MKIESDVAASRVRAVNRHAIKPSAKWILYWMTAFRRTRSNFALQYARDIAKQLDRPLIILEALRIRYRWASDRFHRFIIEGMRDNADACESADVLYYPYVEPLAGAGAGMVAQLAGEACAVVTDDYPCFFHPQMIGLAAKSLSTSLVAVDSNCLMPLSVEERTFTVAHSYRRFMQKELPKHLEHFPDENPLDRRATRQLPLLSKLPVTFERRWPRADFDNLLQPNGLQSLSIDHSIGPGAIAGGSRQAQQLLTRFIQNRLATYAEDRNEPDQFGSSELSPHLHFGQISPHEVFSSVMSSQAWHPGKLRQPNGKMNGFWGINETAEAFIDQLCTWREIGFNMCWREPNYDRFESLPLWAQATLGEHADDRRPYQYSLAEFEQARTHDEIWNAAQRQLVREGRIHNYLRMLWGKKILHWSASPREALDIMIELNNRYALDGRDPNSYSGIFWVLGRYDRAWGPEREIFGKIRFMTSDNTARKHHLKEYLQRYATFETSS